MKSKIPFKLSKKQLLIAVDFIILLGLVYVYIKNPFDDEEVFCLYNRVLGLHCPSCGATRAFYAIMHFNFLDALYYNFFITIVVFIITVVMIVLNLRIVCNINVPQIIKFRWWYYYVGLGLLVVFTVLRNFTTLIY